MIKRRKKGFGKMVVISILSMLIIVVIAITAMLLIVRSYGKKYMVTIEKLPKDFDVILVLGAGVRSDGSPSEILVDRLETALDIYNKDICETFILTGDHGRKNYNEVRAMKDYVMEKGAKESRIFMDHAGFNTYNSMYRARDIFKVKKAIIVTNEYHLPRALYIARKLGIEAYGVASDKRGYYYMSAYKKRELLAQVKAFIDVNILKSLPTFLGEPIPVQSSDGKITDDEL